MPHVLIADDSQHIRKMVSRLLQAESGYDLCAEAENGKEAIDLALQCRPDLIILDLSMPEMNGLQAAHELKKTHAKSSHHFVYASRGTSQPHCGSEYGCGSNRIQERAFKSDGTRQIARSYLVVRGCGH